MPARLELPAIVIVALIAFAIVLPYGDFPLNDDENHAIGTWNFVHLHHFKFAIDTTPPLRAQVVWGAIWTWLFGESFDVLRASTMFLGILALLIVNRTMFLAGIAGGPRVVATLALLFNPLFFWSTNTYMTETPFVFASALAFYCFFRALRNDSMGWFLAGCVAVAISWWIRQGIINIFPPMIVLAAHRERVTRRWKPMLATAVAVLIGYAIMAITRRDLIVASPVEFKLHYQFWGQETFRLPEIAAYIYSDFFFNIQHSALFFLPLSLGVALAWPRRRSRSCRASCRIMRIARATCSRPRPISESTSFKLSITRRVCASMPTGSGSSSLSGFSGICPVTKTHPSVSTAWLKGATGAGARSSMW